MNGIQEYNIQYLNKINKTLEGQPNFIKGYANNLSNVSLSTKYAYLLYVVRFVKNTNKSIEQLTLDDFSNYISQMEYKENGESITSSYRIAVYSALKRFSRYLYSTKKISDDFMLNVPRPKAIEKQNTIEKRKKGFLTKGEIARYIDTIENNNVNEFRQTGYQWNLRDLIIIKLFLLTGMRCSALFKLDTSSIDFEHKKLMVTDKGDKVNEYDLPDDLLDILEEWIDIRRKKIKDNSNALFISNQKRRMDQTSISRAVNKYSITIKGKHITPHKLRATYGTQLYNITKDIYFVQQCMGHSNPKTTELYVREDNKDRKKASDIMSGLIS